MAKKKKLTAGQKASTQIRAVDLFCGAGGLTHGLLSAGIDVRVGYDLDKACAFPYEENNAPARFESRDVSLLTGGELCEQWDGGVSLLAGCAPCQPFSQYMQGNKAIKGDNKWSLLTEFARLIRESSPDLVTMENVPNLVKHRVFHDFLSTLVELDYEFDYQVLECPRYGIPQSRNRLVLIASRLGSPKLIDPTHEPSQFVTVRDAIGKLPELKAGQADSEDALHKAAKLSEINLKRIQNSIQGGSWSDWPDNLITDCHKRKSGERYYSVYGRMREDLPAPTMTTLCYGYGNGRFGHPIQDRAISLREAAIFQTFPPDYKFCPSDQSPEFRTVGRLIGNAVPVRLGEVIGLSLRKHIGEIGDALIC
ncbi:C-5 cytosine-specific DNA methylase [Thiohalobacter thiocyanaticus]|uniref:DNA (cytosine-5-)-methyltransferase n=1 Tax=Thiohalobacter thiocyanaticus TaxID=585455 RepID=A0A1Z4VMI0_9GAMM|nr:DNA (cytosine-5-)-methyltransferase [Thiohalobacter thiocyanaticus]BAZ92558.1 C-5 cytosine-specific DNA methylase [Thiohalobacter thiocyanaticus]